MENNLSNKAKFFGQYVGQRICRYTDWVESGYHIPRIPDVQDNQHLELTPLSDITDEDKKKIRKPNNGYQSQDYLRTKGYALPWMGLSVEKLIEYGWVKLKTLNQ